MDIKFTKAAQEKLDTLQTEDRFLRVVLGKSGCCGYAFTFYVDRERKGDQFIEQDGYKLLYTDTEKLMLQAAKEIDYKRRGLMKDFKVVMK